MLTSESNYLDIDLDYFHNQTIFAATEVLQSNFRKSESVRIHALTIHALTIHALTILDLMILDHQCTTVYRS